MCQAAWSELVQVVACHLFSVKSLTKAMLTYIQLDPQENIYVKFSSKFKHFHSVTRSWKLHLQNNTVILSTGKWVCVGSKLISLPACRGKTTFWQRMQHLKEGKKQNPYLLILKAGHKNLWVHISLSPHWTDFFCVFKKSFIFPCIFMDEFCYDTSFKWAWFHMLSKLKFP